MIFGSTTGNYIFTLSIILNFRITLRVTIYVVERMKCKMNEWIERLHYAFIRTFALA